MSADESGQRIMEMVYPLEKLMGTPAGDRDDNNKKCLLNTNSTY